jgi:ABC-type Fe3+/spermidine/putrescine transport system ATPase subunit
VARGEFVTLLGPSGSGKTTILGIAAGIITPDSGQVILHGRDATDTPPHRRDVGMVFQRYTLFPNKTVAGNVAFPLEVRRRPVTEIRERVAAILELVALSEQADRYPSQLSGGQAQRVALARALVFGPALLLMDEPLGALDRRLRQMLQDEIRRIQRATGVPTLYVTHDQDEAMTLSDRVVIVKDGRVAAEGSPRRLYQDPPSLWAAGFLGDVNAARLQALESLGGQWAKVTTQHGISMKARRPHSVCEPAEAFVMIRPEDCQVSEIAQAAPGAHRGRVVGGAFVGASQRVRIELDAGWTIIAALPGRSAFLSAGREVFCIWNDDAPLVVGP